MSSGKPRPHRMPRPGSHPDEPVTYSLTLEQGWQTLAEHIAQARDEHHPDGFGYLGHMPNVIRDAVCVGLAELAHRHGLAHLIRDTRRLPNHASMVDELDDVNRLSPPATSEP